MFPTDSEESNPFLHDHGGQASTSSTITSSSTGQLGSGGAGSSDQLLHRWPSQQNVSDMSSREICRQLLEPPLGSIPRQATAAPQIGQNPGNMQEGVRGDQLLFQQTAAEMEMHQIKAAGAVSHGGTMLGDHRQPQELLFDPRYAELLRSRLTSAGGQPFSSLLANQEAVSQLSSPSSSSTAAASLHGLGLMYDPHHHQHHYHASLLSQFHQQQQANLTGRLLAEGHHVPAQTLLQAPALSAPPLNVGAPLHVGSATRAAPRGLLLQQQQEADQQQQQQYSAAGSGGLQQQQQQQQVAGGGRAATTASGAHIATTTATTYDQVDACTPRPRWCPTQEQIQILESLFNSGTTTPSRDMIVDIAAQLRKYGSIAEANVFYWFQNRKARAKRKLQPPHAPTPPPSSSSTTTTTTTTSSTSISDDKLAAPPSSDTHPDTTSAGAAAALTDSQPASKSRRVSLKPSSSPTLISSSSSSPFSHHLALTHPPPLLQPPSSLHPPPDSTAGSTPPTFQQLPFPHRFIQTPPSSHLSPSHLMQTPQAAAASIGTSTFPATFIPELDKAQRLLWSQHPHLLSTRLLTGAVLDHRNTLDPTHSASSSIAPASTGSPSSTTSNNPIQASNSPSTAGALLMSRTLSGQQLDPRVCLSLAPPAQHQQALLNYQGTDTPTPPTDEAFLQASSKGILLIDPRHSSNLGCDSSILQANPAFFSQSSRSQQLHMGTTEQQPISNLSSQSSVAMPLARTDDQHQFHNEDQGSRLPVSSTSPNPDQGEQQLHLWEELDTCGSLGWGGHTDPHL